MDITSHHTARHNADVQIALGPIAEKVSRTLCGQVTQERIEQVLHRLLEQEFGDARVTTYLPIFLQRAACETLQTEVQRDSV